MPNFTNFTTRKKKLSFDNIIYLKFKNTQNLFYFLDFPKRNHRQETRENQQANTQTQRDKQGWKIVIECLL